MYPTYELQVHTDHGWIKVEGTESSSTPHHYDTLRAKFDQLVSGTRPYRAHFVREFGYRIAHRYDNPTASWQTVDQWMAYQIGAR